MADGPAVAFNAETARLEKVMGVSNGGGNMMLIVGIACVLIIAAYFMGIIPKNVLSAVGLTPGDKSPKADALTDASTDAPKDATHGSSPPTPDGYETVTGKVIFEGGKGEATYWGCDHFSVDKFPKGNRVGTDKCKVQIDPCKLITKTANDAPQCHTVDSLCSSKIVPSQKLGGKEQCFLTEKSWSHTKRYMKGIQLPKGMSLDVNKGDECKEASEHSAVCSMGGGPQCRWSQHTYQKNPGLQFGLAPGFELTCDGTTHRGPAKS